MKDKRTLLIIVIILYIVLSAVDRFVIKLPTIAFIPFAILLVILIIVALIRYKTR
ncbi:hypothetical protein PV797_09015 [Clostridiaceae bacterium M8S5]|nr:hypothetical protein PV797_09015 [Clostridiaceae bacterium M8S5]